MEAWLTTVNYVMKKCNIKWRKLKLRRHFQSPNRIGTITEVSLRYIVWHHFCIAHVVYVSDLLARKMAAENVTRF